MNVFKFIVSKRGTLYKKTQEPFIRIITVYTTNGIATDFGITAKPERMKKARQVGICDERKIIRLEDGPQIANPDGFDISKGSYQLMYYLDKKEIRVFKVD